MNLFVILKLFHNPSQVPIVILSPGRQPVTRSEKTSITESATELFFYQEDLQNFYKQAIPIVLFYNTRDTVQQVVLCPLIYTTSGKLTLSKTYFHMV